MSTTETISKIKLVKKGLCPLCQLPNAQPLYQLKHTEVYRCSCGMEYIDPSLDAQSMIDIYLSSDVLKEVNPACETYFEYETIDSNSRTIKDYEAALRALDSSAPGKRMLEVGCGTGGFLAFAKAKGWQVHGIDSSPEHVRKTKEKGIEAFCASFFDFSNPSLYDVVVLWDLIEHPQDPLSLIQKSYSLLKPDGILLIATPYYPNILSLLAGIFYKASLGKIKAPVQKMYFLEHTTYFSLQTLRQLLSKGGFAINQYWKTETDLYRYTFSPVMRLLLRFIFTIGRLTGLQNRIILTAKKIH